MLSEVVGPEEGACCQLLLWLPPATVGAPQDQQVDRCVKLLEGARTESLWAHQLVPLPPLLPPSVGRPDHWDTSSPLPPLPALGLPGTPLPLGTRRVISTATGFLVLLCDGVKSRLSAQGEAALESQGPILRVTVTLPWRG